MRTLRWLSPNFTIETEPNNENILFVHCNVYRYNKKIKREIEEAWRVIKHTLKEPFYLMSSRNIKTLKFASLFGFTSFKVVQGQLVLITK
jgi:hypothetical protein